MITRQPWGSSHSTHSGIERDWCGNCRDSERIGDFVYRDGMIQHGVTVETAESMRLHTPEGRGGHFREHAEDYGS